MSDGPDPRRKAITRCHVMLKSMSGRGVVVVTLADRQRTKVEGVVVRSRHDGRKERERRYGESPMCFTIRQRSGAEREVAIDAIDRLQFRPFDPPPG